MSQITVLQATVLVIFLGAGLSCNPSADETDTFKVAIIDQLHDFQPNEDFIERATNILEAEGFTIDIFRGKEVTLNFYEELAKTGYALIIFRAHSGILQANETQALQNQGTTYLFTDESYTVTGRIWDQLGDRVSPARIDSDSPLVFAVNSEFVKYSMSGDFQNTLVIMMGCATAYQSDMAKAFVTKGASAYLGWTASVTLDYVDDATIVLLEHLLVDKLTIQEAVATTMNQVGVHPDYGAHLKYYPENAGNKSVPALIRMPQN
jgi:hypothetical protein